MGTVYRARHWNQSSPSTVVMLPSKSWSQNWRWPILSSSFYTRGWCWPSLESSQHCQMSRDCSSPRATWVVMEYIEGVELRKHFGKPISSTKWWLLRPSPTPWIISIRKTLSIAISSRKTSKIPWKAFPLSWILALPKTANPSWVKRSMVWVWEPFFIWHQSRWMPNKWMAKPTNTLALMAYELLTGRLPWTQRQTHLKFTIKRRTTNCEKLPCHALLLAK